MRRQLDNLKCHLETEGCTFTENYILEMFIALLERIQDLERRLEETEDYNREQNEY